MTATVGLLALQGGYAAHGAALRALGIPVTEVRRPEDLEKIQGLILPGGESTTQIKLLKRFELWAPLKSFIESGRPTLATCAVMRAWRLPSVGAGASKEKCQQVTR